MKEKSNIVVTLRLTEEENKMLEYSIVTLGESRSETLRLAIKKLYNSLRMNK